MTPAGRDVILDRARESDFQQHVLTLAARGGFHGVHIRVSHGSLEGLHSLSRAFPRSADHDDASGVPDLLLVQPARKLLLLPELKTAHGVVSAHQRRWLEWLLDIQDVRAPVWRPTDEAELRAVLLGEPS